MTVEDSTDRLGIGMIIVAWGIGLALVTLFFNDYLKHKQNPNTHLTKQITDTPIVLQRNRADHYVVDILINGQIVEALIDTGATTVAIPATLARQLKLPIGRPQQVTTANGKTIAYHTRIAKIQLGHIVLYDIIGGILQDDDLDTVLLGMSFLKHLKMVQEGETLILDYPITHS